MKKHTKTKSKIAKHLILYLIILLISAALPALHKDLLRIHVSKNTLMVKSPKDSSVQGTATAFEIKAASGRVYTVTNAHVCGLANSRGQILIEEKEHSGRYIPIQILEVYQDHDLCILNGLADYDGLSLGSETEINDSVYAIGYPVGEALNYAEGRVKDFTTIIMPHEGITCEGIHTHMMSDDFIGSICVDEFHTISTDLVIYPGNSGSALVNNYGNVVGVIFASSNRTHWGHAVPLSELVNLLKAY